MALIFSSSFLPSSLLASSFGSFLFLDFIMGSEYDMSVGLNPQNAIKLQNYGSVLHIFIVYLARMRRVSAGRVDQHG